jgi:hypothetical protein
VRDYDRIMEDYRSVLYRVRYCAVRPAQDAVQPAQKDAVTGLMLHSATVVLTPCHYTHFSRMLGIPSPIPVVALLQSRLRCPAHLQAPHSGGGQQYTQDHPVPRISGVRLLLLLGPGLRTASDEPASASYPPSFVRRRWCAVCSHLPRTLRRSATHLAYFLSSSSFPCSRDVSASSGYGGGAGGPPGGCLNTPSGLAAAADHAARACPCEL